MRVGGCLLTFAAFVTGGIVAGAIDWVGATNRRYLDRDEARPLALRWAREACRETRHVRPVDCSDWRFVGNVSENKDGWHFVLQSHDARRTHGIWVGRLGEVDDDRWDDPDQFGWVASPSADRASGK